MSPSRFVQRNQMVFDFSESPLLPVEMPQDCWFVDWSPSLIEPHADVLHRSFRNDLDGTVFVTFKQYPQCVRLLEMTASSPQFLSAATRIIASGDPQGEFEYVAGIQGLRYSDEVGAIQNVGVLPEYRRRGLGQALVLGALHGYKSSGVQRVTLEATTDNTSAIDLYTRIGFTTYRVYLKEIFS